MKEIRGIDAVRYAEGEGILFNVDQSYLLNAESKLKGQATTLHDIQDIFYEKLGHDYDPIDLHSGGESFNLLIERYGDGWIYVPVMGHNPEREEKEAHRLFRKPLKQKEPYCGGDLLDLASRYRPRLRNTGFPEDAALNLLFHAALRLVEREELEAVEDETPLPVGVSRSYGRRRFLVTADVEVSLGSMLCDMCRAEFSSPTLRLHNECSIRLQRVLTKVAARRKAG